LFKITGNFCSNNAVTAGLGQMVHGGF